MNDLIESLKQSAELYKNFLELEYNKYDTVIKNDLDTLDNIVANEQVYYLKMRGIEQKREKLLHSMGYKDKTLKEIIEAATREEKKLLNEKYDELARLILEVKKINNLCKTLIEVRMHRIDKAMKQLGENDNIYKKEDSKGSTKSVLLSKKI